MLVLQRVRMLMLVLELVLVLDLLMLELDPIDVHPRLERVRARRMRVRVRTPSPPSLQRSALSTQYSARVQQDPSTKVCIRVGRWEHACTVSRIRVLSSATSVYAQAPGRGMRLEGQLEL